MDKLLSLIITGALMILQVDEGSSQNCTYSICTNVSCEAIECPKGYIYSNEGGGYCGCCPRCFKPLCCPGNPCFNVKMHCPEESTCEEGYTRSPRGIGFCGCCPACIKD